MKRILLGTTLGRVAMRLRDNVQLMRSCFTCVEEAGTIANDQIATRLVTRICRSEMTFIDVGAHIGSIVSEVARNDRSVHIIAIEAIPEKAASLQARFSNIQVLQFALGERAGDVSFFIDLRQSGYSSLSQPDSRTKNRFTEITVPQRRLDDLVAATDVDVIKIDVEGAELGVLRGSPQVITSCRPIIMFESAPRTDDAADCNKQQVFELLESHHYKLLIPNRIAHNDPGLSMDGFLESHLYPRRTTNYFAVPDERRVEVRNRARKIMQVRAE